MNDNPRIFVDSDVFVALALSKDALHTQALAIIQNLSKKSPRLLTSNYVFAESVTVISQKASHATAIKFIADMYSPQTPFEIMRTNEMLDGEAITIFKKQTSKNTSFIDCTNIAFMQLYHLDAIFSFDEVYRKNHIKMLSESSM